MSEKVEEIRHSRVGASAAHRWMNCAGSVQLVDKLAQEARKNGQDFDTSSIYADEGSAAHHVAEQCLLNNQDAWEWGGQKIESGKRSFTVDAEMMDGVQLYLNHVRKLLAQYEEYGAELVIEKGIGSVLDDEAFGTCDAMIVVPGLGLLIITDFKYGRGVVAEPDGEQTRLYGYYGLENWPYPDRSVQEIELWIVQPRIPHPRGLCREYRTTPDELTAFFTEEALPGMKATREEGALLTIGDWCRFCPARDVCPALKKEAMEFSADADPEALTADEIADILARAPTIKKFLAGVEAEAFRRARNGDTIRGFKLVYKQANRVWKESRVVRKKTVAFEDAVTEEFGDEAYQPRAFKTPPNIEKLEGGKNFVAKWAYKPESGLTIAPEDDKRPAVRLTGEELFGEAGSSETEI